MARDLPEEIATSSLAPINRTAAQVTQKGTHWAPKLTPGEILSDVPLPTKPVLPSCLDLTGQKFGRLTVLGQADKKSAWVVKCICGTYSHRKAKVLRGRDEGAKMCARCHKVDQLRKYSGDWPDRSKEPA